MKKNYYRLLFTVLFLSNTFCYAQQSKITKEKADVNSDKSVDISDIVAVINYMAFGGANGDVEPGGTDPAVEAGLCPDTQHPHAIDMGYGVKYACCNVGASALWEYGGYYAWGETEEKNKYDWSTYKYCDGSEETCQDLGADISGTEYDVAYVKWGNGLRMPKKNIHGRSCRQMSI